MTVAASRGFGAILFRLRVETVVVAFVRLVVKERTREIRKLFAWAMTALALKIWRRRKRGSRVWPTDDCALVRAYGRRDWILVSLSSSRLEDEGPAGARERGDKHDRKDKMADHGYSFPGGITTGKLIREQSVCSDSRHKRWRDSAIHDVAQS